MLCQLDPLHVKEALNKSYDTTQKYWQALWKTDLLVTQGIYNHLSDEMIQSWTMQEKRSFETNIHVKHPSQ